MEKQILEDITPIKELWAKVIEKYNTRFHSLGGFLIDKERSKVAGDVFRSLDRYIEILKNYNYKELYENKKREGKKP